MNHLTVGDIQSMLVAEGQGGAKPAEVRRLFEHSKVCAKCGGKFAEVKFALRTVAKQLAAGAAPRGSLSGAAKGPSKSKKDGSTARTALPSR